MHPHPMRLVELRGGCGRTYDETHGVQCADGLWRPREDAPHWWHVDHSSFSPFQNGCPGAVTSMQGPPRDSDRPHPRLRQDGGDGADFDTRRAPSCPFEGDRSCTFGPTTRSTRPSKTSRASGPTAFPRPRAAEQRRRHHLRLHSLSDGHLKAWHSPQSRPATGALQPQLRVRQPGAGQQGLITIDQVNGYGRLVSLQLGLHGKKEIYVPDNIKFFDSDLEYKEMILDPRYPRRDLIRYELHRVWVAMLPGPGYTIARRVFYMDEDSWLFVVLMATTPGGISGGCPSTSRSSSTSSPPV